MCSSDLNLLASEVSRKSGFGEFSLFSFTPLGIGVWLLGSLILVITADRLPDRGTDKDDLLADLEHALAL